MKRLPFCISLWEQHVHSLFCVFVQAFVWDLGFKDMPVDKIVEASVAEVRGKDRAGGNKGHENAMVAAMDALSNAAPGSMPGPR